MDFGPLGARRQARFWASFSTGEADLRAHWGVRALHACFFCISRGVLKPIRASDCTIAVVSNGLGSTECEAPSSVLVVTELLELELVFQLERPT